MSNKELAQPESYTHVFVKQIHTGVHEAGRATQCRSLLIVVSVQCTKGDQYLIRKA